VTAGTTGAAGQVGPVGTTAPGERLQAAVDVMDRLRSPGGCSWDAAQDHTSLLPYLIEEAYEAYEALQAGDPAAVREELGDVLLQVLFHARLGQEATPPWSIDDIADGLVAKLVRRHPHVFADPDALSTEDVERRWDVLKAAEKAERGETSVTDGIPLAMPALSLAAKLQGRGSKAGNDPGTFDVDDPLAARLWQVVLEAREAGVDPEALLRRTAQAYRDDLRSQGL
jgi:XTP/dITP diphosphohydrolase